MHDGSSKQILATVLNFIFIKKTNVPKTTPTNKNSEYSVSLTQISVVPGLYTGKIEDAEITIPKKVTTSGEHISHNVTSYHEDGPVHFNVTISNKEHWLVVQPAKHFLAPGFLIERHKRDVHVRLKPKKESIECHYQGHVHGELNSRVAISACNGLVRFSSLTVISRWS